jgi:hypothetical protein
VVVRELIIIDWDRGSLGGNDGICLLLVTQARNDGGGGR